MSLDTVTIRDSSMLTRPLATPEVQIHKSSRRTGTCIGEHSPRSTHSSLLTCPQTRVPAPSVLGPCAGADTHVLAHSCQLL